ncbi:serine hydrolase domain-containing protein [Psychromonas aquimarina]|uniref:serine hydrolase domain-containing protein n=1 Tax=Psychromonas aquimarina TaxID=444919 RepID=UPI000409A063|nr:serine hydrolase domain-containing protein [Psychromonas aquimarina]
MNKLSLKPLAAALTLSFTAPVFANSGHPLAKYLTAPGASVTLPVEAAKQPFDSELVQAAYDSFSSFHAQMGGDHTLYYLTNFTSVMRTDWINPHDRQIELKRNLNADIGKITFNTDSEGELTLDEYLAHPTFRHQGVMMIHKGEVVYEAYPGMAPTDVHLWASAAKSVTGLISAMLIEEGLLDPKAPASRYVTELKGSAWDDVTVMDLINHTSGLDIEENNSSILDPDSVFVRFIMATFGTTQTNVEIEDWREILKEVEPLPGEKPGERFRYSSLNTQVLGQVIEQVTGKRWADVVEERIWGTLGARMPLLAHLTPDGTALNLGIISSTLEDFAKYANLFTPSWPKSGHKQLVTPALLERIRSEGTSEAFIGGAKNKQALGLFAEQPLKGAYQFDFIFEDGALYKHGNTGQGMYVDPERDFAAVYFSATPYISPYGEIKAPAYFRKAAKQLTEK